MVHRTVFNAVKSLSKQVGYVYLFRYINPQTREDLIKIGISESPKRRFKEVEASLPGTLYFQGSFAVWNPLETETGLHQLYRHKKKIPRYAGPNAGKDEFFALSSWEWAKVFGFLMLKNLLASCFFVFPVITIILLIIGPGKLADILLAIQNSKL